eukprot:10114543-Prorocentrum_lima.AAC.1
MGTGDAIGQAGQHERAMQGATHMLPSHLEAHCVDLHGASQNARHPGHHGRQPVCHWTKSSLGTASGSSGRGYEHPGRSHHRVVGLLQC